MLREAGQLGTGEIVEMLGMKRPAVLRRLKGLEEAGLIEWSG
jgi:DNA-binding Lrp family transcriptional regulator